MKYPMPKNDNYEIEAKELLAKLDKASKECDRILKQKRDSDDRRIEVLIKHFNNK